MWLFIARLTENSNQGRDRPWISIATRSPLWNWGIHQFHSNTSLLAPQTMRERWGALEASLGNERPSVETFLNGVILSTIGECAYR